MGRCPHCEQTVDAQFEFLGKRSGSDSSDAKFQVVCPNCDCILGGTILSKIETSGGLL
ncbi:MAG: hypothetical protein ABEI96_05305 [Haloarculaceae archaeon]